MKKFKNIWIYILSLLASSVGIFLNFYLARFLEAETFGRLQYYVALATTLSQFLLFGLNSFVIREAKNDKQNDNVLNKCFSLYFTIIIFSFPILCFALSNIMGKGSTVLLIVLIAIMSILMGVNTLVSSYFQGSGKYQLKIIFENLIPKLAMLIFAFVFMAVGKIQKFADFYIIFYIVVYSLVAIPFVLIYFKRIIFSFSKEEIVSIVFFFGVTLTYSLGNNLTKVLQGGLYQNDVALAIISVSVSIVSLIKTVSAVLDNMIKPIFAKKKREGDIDGLLDAYRFDTRMNSYVSVPLYIFFIVHSSKFLAIFGESYTIYSSILVIISLANAVTDLTGPNGTMLAMTGNEKWELINGIVYFAVYIAFVFAFSFEKVYGLCLALLVAEIAVNILKFIEVAIIYKKLPLDLKTVLTLFFEMIVNLIVIVLLYWLNVSLWLWMCISFVVGVALVGFNMFLFSLYRKYDFKTLLKLKV